MGRALRILLLAALAVVSAACGGGGASSTSSAKLASGDVAVVGTTHITKSQLDHAITLRVKAMTLSKQTPPKVGTTDYTTNVVQPTLQHLVQGAEVRNIATALHVTATPADVQKAITASVTQYYGGSQSKFQADVDRYGLTEADLNYEFQTSVLETKITEQADRPGEGHRPGRPGLLRPEQGVVQDHVRLAGRRLRPLPRQGVGPGGAHEAGRRGRASRTCRRGRSTPAPTTSRSRPRRARSTKRSSSRRSRCRRTSSRRSSRSTRRTRRRA